jgi:hypothetical protein
MNKKIVLCILSATYLITSSLQARTILLEVKGAGFFPTSHLDKKIYGNTGIFGAELNINIYERLYGWVSIDGLSKKGCSLIGHTKTKMSYIPLGFGLKCFHPFYCADFYLGIGILAGRIHTHDDSPYVAPTYSKWGCGGIAKAGCIINLAYSTFIDLFFNYSFIKTSSHNTNGGTVYPHPAKLNAAQVGLGLGYRF